MDEDLAKFKESIINGVVADLVKKKQSLPAGSGNLPRGTYSGAVERLKSVNLHILEAALRQRVKRAYASARAAPSTPLPPPLPAPAAEVTFTYNATPTSEITLSVDVAGAAASSTQPSSSSDTTSKKSGGRPKGSTIANRAEKAKKLKECTNAIAVDYAHEKDMSDASKKRLPVNFLRDLIKEKKKEVDMKRGRQKKTG